MRSEIFALSLFLSLSLSGCSTQCIRNSDCSSGLTCVSGVCTVLVPDGGDLAPPADLRPEPDLKPAQDLTPPKDLLQSG